MIQLTKFTKKHKKLIETLYCFAILLLVCFAIAQLFLAEPAKGEVTESPVVKVSTKMTSLPTVEVKAPVIAKSDVWEGTGKEVETTIRKIAQEVGLKDVERALAIGRCESGLNAAAVGDHGWSHGIWQIYLKAHPSITKAQAHNVDWSTHWALSRMKQGSWSMWTCNKLI